MRLRAIEHSLTKICLVLETSSWPALPQLRHTGLLFTLGRYYSTICPVIYGKMAVKPTSVVEPFR